MTREMLYRRASPPPFRAPPSSFNRNFTVELCHSNSIFWRNDGPGRAILLKKCSHFFSFFLDILLSRSYLSDYWIRTGEGRRYLFPCLVEGGALHARLSLRAFSFDSILFGEDAYFQIGSSGSHIRNETGAITSRYSLKRKNTFCCQLNSSSRGKTYERWTSPGDMCDMHYSHFYFFSFCPSAVRSRASWCV
jgi:hypothetical protein